MLRLALMLLFCLTLAGLSHQVQAAAGLEPSREAILVITAAQDSTRSFHWEEGPGQGQLSLTWPEGRLIIPSDLPLQGDDQGDLGIPLLAGFGGTGPDGPVPLSEGLQEIEASLAFGDGRIQWLVSDGELEIRGSRIIYRRPWVGADKAPGKGLQDQRANLLMIGGLLLLIAVLLRRARHKTRQKD